MLTTQSLLAWTIMSIGLVLLPGPDTMLVAGHAARRGFKAGMAAIGGIQLGGLFYMALVRLRLPLGAERGARPVHGSEDRRRALSRLARHRPAARGRAAHIGGSASAEAAARRIAVQPGLHQHCPQSQGRDLLPGRAAAVRRHRSERALAGHAADRDRLCAGLSLVHGAGGAATHAGRRVGRSSAMRWFEGALGVGFIGLAGRLALARNI